MTVTTSPAPASAQFSWSILPDNPLSVSFQDIASNATGILWASGDGVTATDLNVTIELKNTDGFVGTVDLRLLNAGGTVVYSDKMMFFTDRTIVLPDVVAGLHFLEIRTETGVFMERIQLY